MGYKYPTVISLWNKSLVRRYEAFIYAVRHPSNNLN